MFDIRRVSIIFMREKNSKSKKLSVLGALRGICQTAGKISTQNVRVKTLTFVVGCQGKPAVGSRPRSKRDGVEEHCCSDLKTMHFGQATFEDEGVPPPTPRL